MEDLPHDAPITGEVPVTDLPDEHLASKEVPVDDLPHDYTSPGQKALTAIEGVGRGLTGGLSDVMFKGMRSGASAIGVPDQYLDMVAPSSEDEAAREEANPLTAGVSKAGSTVAGMVSGAGIPGLIERGAGAAATAATPFLGKMGSGFLKSAISGGLLQGGDEISNAMLGHGDPSTPVASAMANMAGTALLSGMTGWAFAGASKGLEALSKAKFLDKANEFLAGIGAANTGTIPEGLESSKTFKDGVKFYTEGMPALIGKISKLPADLAGGYLGEKAAESVGASPAVGATVGAAAAHKLLGSYLEKFLNIPLNTVNNKYVVPAVLKVLSGGNSADLANAVNYAVNVGKGAQKLNTAVDSVFRGTEQQIINADAVERNREKLRKSIENRDLDKQIEEEKRPSPQAYAEGGEVQGAAAPVTQSAQHLATHYPEQNILLQAARSRVDGYLNSIRPQKAQGQLPYDTALPNKQADRSYDKALDIATHPLGVMEHVSRGTLTPEHMKHLSSMYPEIQTALAKQVAKRMVHQQLKDEKLPYKTRQSLTLFMGSPLDSTFSPGAMASVQQLFMRSSQPNQRQQPGKPPSESSMKGIQKVPNQYRTPGEARATRAQRTK